MVVQLIKEFWLATVVALLWAGYNVHISADRNAALWVVFVKNFAPSFFLVSWATGQYFRVRKQSQVEVRLSGIVQRLQHVTEQIEDTSKNLLSTVSGGDSYCYIAIGSIDPATNNGLLTVVHMGEFPLYDAHARIVDLEKFAEVKDRLSFETMAYTDMNIRLGNLIPRHASMMRPWNLGSGPTKRYNIFYTARNGSFIQLLRFMRRDSGWVSATIVKRDDTTLMERVDDRYPRKSDGTVDWS